MYEKTSPNHPDKIADRIAGAVVDLAYAVERNPRIAVEVLIGHGKAYVIIETSLGRGELAAADVVHAVRRICPYIDESNIHVTIASQDPHLADNQRDGLRSGDNGIFRGMPVTTEQRILTSIAATIHANFPTDGKYIIEMTKCRDGVGTPLECYTEYFPELTICQSNATDDEIYAILDKFFEDPKTLAWWHKLEPQNYDQPCMGYMANINPLGPWTGGTDADSGATNRKLGSDMGDAVSGGGLHGKDLSKMDVTANIVCHMLAQRHHTPVECYCAIGDQSLTFRFPQPGDFPDNLPAHPHITMTVAEAVEMARLYILTDCGGSFENFACWGLIRPDMQRRFAESCE